MLAAKGNIVVFVDPKQNAFMQVGGKEIVSQKRYNENFRERNPVVAEVIDGVGEIKKGMFLVCNYSHFDDSSPYRLSDDLYSIPADSSIIGEIGQNTGELSPLCGNVFVKRITKPSLIELPPDLKKPQINHGFVDVTGEGWEKGQEIFWYNYSDYEVVYSWKLKEYRYIKIEKTEIVGYIKK